MQIKSSFFFSEADDCQVPTLYSVADPDLELTVGGRGGVRLPCRLFFLLRYFGVFFIQNKGPSPDSPLLFTILVKTLRYIVYINIMCCIVNFPPPPSDTPLFIYGTPHKPLPSQPVVLQVKYSSQLLADMLPIRISNSSLVRFHSLACEPPWTETPSLKS